MEFKMNVFALGLLVFVLNTAALPRDSSVVKVEPALQVRDNYNPKDVEVKSFSSEVAGNEIHIPGRVLCEYQEPTEDPVCQEHCTPKGYKHGLCTNGVCSCI